MKVLIVGAGEVGFHLAERLSQENQDVILIEADPERAEFAQHQLDVLTVVGNGASLPVLERAGVGGARMLLAVTSQDEVNLISCLAANRLDVRSTIARISNPEYYTRGSVLSREQLGIDLMINPERECAWETYQLLQSAAATDVAQFADGRSSSRGWWCARERRWPGARWPSWDRSSAAPGAPATTDHPDGQAPLVRVPGHLDRSDRPLPPRRPGPLRRGHPHLRHAGHRRLLHAQRLHRGLRVALGALGHHRVHVRGGRELRPPLPGRHREVPVLPGSRMAVLHRGSGGSLAPPGGDEPPGRELRSHARRSGTGRA